MAIDSVARTVRRLAGARSSAGHAGGRSVATVTAPRTWIRYSPPAHRYSPVPQIVNAQAIGLAMR